MTKLCFAAVICFVAVSSSAIAQTYEVPKDYSLKTKDDYAKYEGDIIKTIDWLELTPWNDQPEKRDEAKAFYLKWIEGSPTVSVEINSKIAKLSKNNPELFGSYMYGYTKYALVHKTDFDINQAKLAGIKGLINKYTLETGHKKNSDVEKLIKIDMNGKLEDWIKTDFNKE